MHNFISYFTVFIILLLAVGIFIIPSAKNDNIHEFTLDNGMRFLVIENAKIPAVTHMIWYNVGAADELQGKSGFAHLFEHLMFKSTDKLQSGEFSKLIAYYGGNDNAFTSQNSTAYFQTIIKERLPLVMMMEADRMRNLQLSAEMVERERDIVLEERSMRTDNNPASLLMEKVNAAFYGSHPYATPVIGWREEIEKLSIDDVAAFYDKYYHPNYATVVVSGDITVDKLKQLAKKYYGAIPASPEQRAKRDNITTMPPDVKQHLVNYQDERVNTAQWIKKYQAPSASTGQTKLAMPLVLLANILGGGQTGRLYQSLVVEQKIAVSAGAYYNDMTLGPTAFSLYVTPAQGVSFAIIEQAVTREIAKLLEYGITSQELTHMQNSLAAEYIYAKDGIRAQAFIYGNALASGLSPQYIAQWPQRIKKIGISRVMQAAKYVLSGHNYLVGRLSSVDNAD